ncbi:MAG: acylphosphatase [archaeon]
MQRVHVLIEGSVTGVGFRFFVQRNASLLNIKGWIKNISENKIEAVFEGQEQDIKKLLEICKEGPSLSYIKTIKVKEEEFQNLTKFEVK